MKADPARLRDDLKQDVPETLTKGGRRMDLDYAYDVRRRAWQRSGAARRLYGLLQESETRASQLLHEFVRFLPHFRRIALEDTRGLPAAEPRWVNGWLPGLDGVTIYGLLATENPRWYVEVGSGNSTKFARRAIRDHGLRTQILSIDPQPREEIDALCDRVVRERLEDVDPAQFEQFQPDDLLFVDCSHRSFQGSDVTVFFTEILPILPHGLIYGIHDIWLPEDYPLHWRDRFYNEQYLLAAYLFGGADGDQILLPNYFLSSFSPAIHILNELWQDPKFEGIEAGGGCFWMRRGAARAAKHAPTNGNV